jgi:hypothetical protein
VYNGFTYYYGITAFDYNYLTELSSTKVLWSEGQRGVAHATPRRDPCNYVAGQVVLLQTSGNPRLDTTIHLDVLSPLEVQDATLYLVYTPVLHHHTPGNPAQSRYRGYIQAGDGQLIDSVAITAGNRILDGIHAFRVQNGVQTTIGLLRDSIPSDRSIFSSITVEQGMYPESLLVGSRPGPWADYFAYWPYRGNDYEVRWTIKGSGSSANSVMVIDKQAGDTIVYRPYDPEPDHAFDTLASGWCFLSHLGTSDTLVLFGAPPATNNTKYLYINGGLVGLKQGGFLQPGDVLPAAGDIWTVHGDTGLLPAPVNACFEIQCTAGYIDTLSPRALAVKVVPNPLIISNDWSPTLRNPMIKFINLPADCTIRIFNLNGELVDVFVHHHDQGAMLFEQGGDAWWDIRNMRGQEVASGIYVFHVQSSIGQQTGKFVIIR